MARVVFFSFDYDDVWRVNQVRNSGAFVGERRSGFRDKAQYEQVKRQGDAVIKRWIREQMQGCSVTCVLIGSATHKSKWVHFEIEESISSGMGLVGVHVHKLKVPGQGNQSGTLFAPPNPMDDHKMPGDDAISRLFADRASDLYETHTWEPTGSFGSLFGSNDLGVWVEEAARRAGRV